MPFFLFAFMRCRSPGGLQESGFLDRKAGVPLPTGHEGGKVWKRIEQVAYLRCRFVFKKLGFDIFDISFINKHPGKVRLSFYLHSQVPTTRFSNGDRIYQSILAAAQTLPKSPQRQPRPAFRS